METYTDANKRVVVVSGSNAKFYQDVGKAFGWDVDIGNDRFFNIPRWWVLDWVERGTLLVTSIELLKQLGFLNYFLQLADEKRLSWYAGKRLRMSPAPALVCLWGIHLQVKCFCYFCMELLRQWVLSCVKFLENSSSKYSGRVFFTVYGFHLDWGSMIIPVLILLPKFPILIGATVDLIVKNMPARLGMFTRTVK